MKQFLTFVVFLMVCGIQAQTLWNDTVSDREHRLDSVLVVGHRVSSSVKEGKPVQQMDRETIGQLGLQSLSDVIKRFAGANVRDYGGIGGMKTVSVRNLGAHHTAVSYDGVAISNTQAGQIDIGRYSLDNIQMVSLSLGDGIDLMQTARHHASAGVLTIQSERPHFEQKDWALRLRMKGGSFGQVSPSLRYWQKLGEGTALSVDGTYMRVDGDYPYTLVNGCQRTKEYRSNSDIYSWKGEANLYHTFAATGGELSTKVSWYSSERGLPGPVILYRGVGNERLWDEDFFVQATYGQSLGEHWKLKGHLKYTHTWNRYEDVDVKYVGGKQVDVNRQDEYYGSAVVGWMPLKGLSLVLAEDLSYNTLRNNINTGTNDEPALPKRITSLTSLALRCKWQRLSVDANVVGTFAKEKVEVGTGPADRHRLSPSLSLSYRLLDRENLYLRAMYKNTFRLPTFNDLYYLRMGNTGLRPEKAREYNAGLTWSGHLPWQKSFLSVTVDGYFNDVDDKIVAFPSTYVWRMANFGKVHIYGLDATMAVESPLSRCMSVEIAASYTYQKSTDDLDSSPTYGSQLPYTPRHSGSGSLLFNSPWVNVGYSLLLQGKRWSSSQNTWEYELKPYAEHTLSLSREFRFRTWRMILQGTVYNLTDKQYEVISYYPMPGRSWTITMNVEL